MVNVFVYTDDGSVVDVSDLLVSVKYTCSLDKPSQQVNITLAYSIYSTSFPSPYIASGQKIELYNNGICMFRGKVNISELKANEEQLDLTCYDYIWQVTKSKVVHNFSDISAYDAVCKIFNDLEIPYSKNGVLGGPDSEGAKININHLIKNKSAYDACMMIATELHTQYGTFYYMFMDVEGNVNLMPCDKYWSKQVIKPCTDPLLENPDGTMISLSYKNDMSEMITRIQLFDSKGNPVDIETGESSGDDSEGGGHE